METRKHPETDINKQSWLHLGLGLVMACGLVLMAFEWKTFTETLKNAVFIPDSPELVREEVLNYTPPPPPPMAYIPPPPTVIDEFRLVDDPLDVKVEIEFNIESVEISDFGELGVEGFGDPVEFVSDPLFTLVEEMPRFRGCENIRDETEAGVCFQRELVKFLQQELVYPEPAKTYNKEGKVYVYFVVDKDGSITDVNVEHDFGYGSAEAAANVIKKLPKFVPGKQRGRPVKVEYRLPISFRLR